MNYWVCTSGRYRATSVLGRVHAAFFTSNQIKAMIYMLDKIVWARIMTALDLDFQKAMHYHDEGYESDNDYGLPPHVMRPVYIYSVFTTKVAFNPAEYKVTLCTIFPFTPRWSRSLPFHEWVCQHLTFDKTPTSMPEEDSEDKEYLMTVDLDDPVWSKEPVPDSHEYLGVHEIPRLASPPHSQIKECQQPHPAAKSRSASNPTTAAKWRSASNSTPAT